MTRSKNDVRTKVVLGNHETPPGTFKAYLIGFASSMFLTLAAFILVNTHLHETQKTLSTAVLIGVIICLAVVQLGVQLVCFLHVGRESKPRWNLTALVMALIVLFIIVIGSLWIMSNLNYRMMSSPNQVNEYLKEQDRL